MRKMTYISPTSFKQFCDDQDTFYINYLAESHPPRFAQTQPMAVGSAFDAFVKNHLHEKLFGKGKDPRFDLQTLFEAQVESQNRDWAYVNGAHCFKLYLESGALADLALELSKAIGEPKFEISIQGMVSKQDAIKHEVQDIVLLGKPDLFYINKEGHFSILDWKVSGFCSKTGASPAKGFIQIRHDDNRTESHHKDAIPMMCQGVMINVAHKLEDVNNDWAAQLAIYAWLAGAEIGDEFITCIDQLVCRPNPGGKFPRIRIAQHRLRVGSKYQQELFNKLYYMWGIINSDYIFRNMTRAESYEHQKMLEEKAKLLKDMLDNPTDEDQMFLDMSKSGY